MGDIDRSIVFCEAALAPPGVTARLDYDGKDGPPGHPDLKGFGAHGRMIFRLRQGSAEGRAAHVGFVAASVDAAHGAAMAAGATDNGAPGPRLHYEPRYYAARVLDPDGCSLELVHKSW